ncbi:hypothetical protein IAG41_11440 [Sphingomonas sp. JC676]|uniref:hypothetical protein n=1 Tax=Sphingomonas sp. JC676 TaxID=2768065 RepID=UPI001657746C|nr:hypothetical protein [Sphingomonas sp. JC676]MBC9033009.1 hypothetical protein [Sphingomonas sp. JC676]
MNAETEIAGQLHEQLALLVDYCDLYDAGKRTHAKSIAVRLGTIFMDMLQTPGGGKFVQDREVRFASIRGSDGPADPGYIPSYNSSAAILGIAPKTSRFLPFCSGENATTSWLRLGKWWPEPVFTSPNANLRITRRELITQMRNKDGGGHGYETPLQAYIEVALKSAGWSAGGTASNEATPLGMHFAIMRHIAHETLVSLVPALPDFPSLPYDPSHSGLEKQFAYVLPPLLPLVGSQSPGNLSMTLGKDGASSTYTFDFKASTGS